MSSDPISTAMMWVGALMVLTPTLFAGVVIGVWWYTKKRRPADPSALEPPVQATDGVVADRDH